MDTARKPSCNIYKYQVTDNYNLSVDSEFLFPAEIINATFIIWFKCLYVSPIYFP